ncbi:MAG TPA: Arc family DNA-binding protein [Bacteroidota bacterium]
MSDKKKFLLRLDDDLYTALEKWAADDLRSVNAEIEFLLTEAVKKAGRGKNPAGSSKTKPASR